MNGRAIYRAEDDEYTLRVRTRERSAAAAARLLDDEALLEEAVRLGIQIGDDEVALEEARRARAAAGTLSRSDLRRELAIERVLEVERVWPRPLKDESIRGVARRWLRGAHPQLYVATAQGSLDAQAAAAAELVSLLRGQAGFCAKAASRNFQCEKVDVGDLSAMTVELAREVQWLRVGEWAGPFKLGQSLAFARLEDARWDLGAHFINDVAAATLTYESWRRWWSACLRATTDIIESSALASQLRAEDRVPCAVRESAKTGRPAHEIEVLSRVDSTEITLGDVKRRMQERRAMGSSTAWCGEHFAVVTLDVLIEEEIALREAARLRLRVTSDEVDAALARAARLVGLDDAASLARHYAGRGLPAAELRRRFERRLLAERVFALELPPRRPRLHERSVVYTWEAYGPQSPTAPRFVVFDDRGDREAAYANAELHARRVRDGRAPFCEAADLGGRCIDGLSLPVFILADAGLDLSGEAGIGGPYPTEQGPGLWRALPPPPSFAAMTERVDAMATRLVALSDRMRWLDWVRSRHLETEPRFARLGDGDVQRVLCAE